jgi:hypothetical protein
MKFVVSLIAIGLVGSVTFVVLLELLLSGGGGNAQDLSQGPKAGQSKQERTGGEKAREEGEELEWVAGVVLKAASDKHAVVVKPDDGERQPFTYKPENVEITLDGKEVEPDAIDEGQRVSIGYEMVTTNKDREVNVAQFIKLEPKKGSPGDESTG